MLSSRNHELLDCNRDTDTKTLQAVLSLVDESDMMGLYMLMSCQTPVLPPTRFTF